jgi:hypothetical protein
MPADPDRDPSEISVTIAIAAEPNDPASKIYLKDLRGREHAIGFTSGSGVLHRRTCFPHRRGPLTGETHSRMFLRCIVEGGPDPATVLDSEASRVPERSAEP